MMTPSLEMRRCKNPTPITTTVATLIHAHGNTDDPVLVVDAPFRPMICGFLSFKNNGRPIPDDLFLGQSHTPCAVSNNLFQF